MSVALDDHAELTEAMGEQAREVLRASWNEATRSFTAPALGQVYLRGARALQALGRGNDLVVAYLQQAPAVAREIGEDAVGALTAAALRCASRTSAGVIAALVEAAPIAARRLGERQLFEAFLALVENLLAQAPRGVRPMLARLDALLGQLSLGGLRRWVQWGVQAHRADFPAQERYFGLESPEALAVLQQERKGTLFVDVQRRLRMYLRALWGRDFYLRPTSGDYESREGYRPFVEHGVIHLPDAYDDVAGASGLDLYRAAAIHAAAHLVYGRGPRTAAPSTALSTALSAEGLDPLQRAMVELVEDARIEALAIRAFPGLQPLWARLHQASPAAAGSCADHMSRLARALLDPGYSDPGELVARGRELFARAQPRLHERATAWELGTELAHVLARTAPPFRLRADQVAAVYRDDNRVVWERDADESGDGEARPAWLGPQTRRKVSLMEFINETDVETAGDDAQEVWVLSTELFPYEDFGISYNAIEGKEPAPEPYHYPEWDYQIQAERPHWVTLVEPRAASGDAALIDAALARHKPVASRIKRVIETVQPQGVQRLRRLVDGDEIDINAAVASLIDAQLGRTPDPRVMMRSVRRQRDLAVLLLVDLSQSTQELVRGGAGTQTVLDLAREAGALLADALHRIGDPFAIHGFSSDGRHDVRYLRFKDFDAPYDAQAKARLAGMGSGLSTRMGAAMRHAGTLLRQQAQARRLLLVLTDGEPADVDVRDPQYLRLDARKAVEDLARQGVSTYCLSLDPHADDYVARIFGARNYRVLDRVERLPEQLPALYLGLTRT